MSWNAIFYFEFYEVETHKLLGKYTRFSTSYMYEYNNFHVYVSDKVNSDIVKYLVDNDIIIKFLDIIIDDLSKTDYLKIKISEEELFYLKLKYPDEIKNYIQEKIIFEEDD